MKEIKLKNASFVDLFEQNRDYWLALAQRAYEYAKSYLDPRLPVRVDDVVEIFTPFLAIDPRFMKYKDSKPKLTQNYWAEYFGDLILNRLWEELEGGSADAAEGERGS